MTDSAFIIVRYYDAFGIRIRGSYSQELRIRMSEFLAVIGP